MGHSVGVGGLGEELITGYRPSQEVRWQRRLLALSRGNRWQAVQQEEPREGPRLKAPYHSLASLYLTPGGWVAMLGPLDGL